jgi:hypothetical protein
MKEAELMRSYSIVVVMSVRLLDDFMNVLVFISMLWNA